MEIINKHSNNPKGVSLILGYFDGIHLGHQNVIKSALGKEKVLITFSSSPAEYFKKDYKQIYSREYNYKLANKIGIDYIYEQDFSQIADLSAEEYLKNLLEKFKPEYITTGFNHYFGKNRQGSPEFLKNYQSNFIYNCVKPTFVDGEIVSSTKIKEFITSGDIKKANKFLTHNFIIKSKVIEGAKIGRELGFPTANMKYPENIVRMPYGVYKIRVLNMPAVMNWGIKPTFNTEESLEIHIPNFEANLYGQELEIEILSKIRNEKVFDSLEELKIQIKKDVDKCLK